MTLKSHDRASYEITAHGGFEEPRKRNLSGRFSFCVIKWNCFCQALSLQLHCVKDTKVMNKASSVRTVATCCPETEFTKK